MDSGTPDLADLRNDGSTSRQRVEFSVNAAEKLNETLNAFLQIDRSGALRRAEEIDKNPQQFTKELPLRGVPIAIKDNICVR